MSVVVLPDVEYVITGNVLLYLYVLTFQQMSDVMIEGCSLHVVLA